MGQPVLLAVLASGSDSIHTRLQAKQEMTQLHRPRQCVLYQYRPLSSESRGARPSVNAAHHVHISNMFVFFLFTYLNLTEFALDAMQCCVTQFLPDPVEGATIHTRKSSISFRVSSNYL